jgi:hypothetical protein
LSKYGLISDSYFSSKYGEFSAFPPTPKKPPFVHFAKEFLFLFFGGLPHCEISPRKNALIGRHTTIFVKKTKKDLGFSFQGL